MRLEIPLASIEAMRAASANAAPSEACGLLFGEDHVITSVSVTENVADDPQRRFEIDPRALFAALRAERTGGPKLLGYWHSHPSGDATPSATDAAMAQPDGKIWLILGAGRMTAWVSGRDGLVELPIESL